MGRVLKHTNLKSKIIKELNRKSSSPKSINDLVFKVSGNDLKMGRSASTTIRELISQGDITVDAGWKLHLNLKQNK